MEIKDSLLPTSVTYSSEFLSSDAKVPTMFEINESSAENIAGKGTLQTAAQKFHGDIARYRNILANVLDYPANKKEKGIATNPTSASHDVKGSELAALNNTPSADKDTKKPDRSAAREAPEQCRTAIALHICLDIMSYNAVCLITRRHIYRQKCLWTPRNNDGSAHLSVIPVPLTRQRAFLLSSAVCPRLR